MQLEFYVQITESLARKLEKKTRNINGEKSSFDLSLHYKIKLYMTLCLVFAACISKVICFEMLTANASISYGSQCKHM